MFIRESLEKFYESQPRRWAGEKLNVSELGYHPAGAMRRILHGDQKEFSVVEQKRMDNGTHVERATMDPLAYLYKMDQQFPLYDGRWNGYADGVIGHGTKSVTIIEHKFTSGGQFFNYKSSLPRSQDILQVTLYGHLYEKMFGVKPRLITFHRAHGNELECDVSLVGDQVHIKGELVKFQWDKNKVRFEEVVTDYEKVFDWNPAWMRAYYELLFDRQAVPTLEEWEDEKDFDWAIKWFEKYGPEWKSGKTVDGYPEGLAGRVEQTAMIF